MSSFRALWQNYRTDKRATVSLIIIILFSIISYLAPLILPRDPMKLSLNLLSPPSAEFLMGTDDLGRDILTRTIYGARVSLFVGFTSSIISIFVGVLIGATSGYFGGRVDNILMRFTEMFLVIPQFFLALLIVSIFGTGIHLIIVVIAVLSWPGTARLVRAQFLSLKERTYVEAAVAIGAKDATIIFSEILPNTLSPIITNASLRMARAIILESSLSFLGLGDPTLVSWGKMLHDAQRFLRVGWWMSFFPGLAIFITVFALNSIGDGLNMALNPRQKER